MKSKSIVRRLFPVLFAGVAGWSFQSLPALAQKQNKPVAMASSGGIEEVIVTAQKRAESVQNVAFTVTPFTSEALERQHVKDLRDITGSLPNVQIHVNAGVSNASAISIRGIGVNNQPSPFAGTEVATVIDGVVQGTDQYGLTNLFDVERIEVLAGPQGTLFGANTTGGVVNIIMKQPTGQYDAYGQVTVGNYNRTEVGVGVDFPIVEDTLAAKISFSHDGRDGFFTNLYDDSNVGAVNENTARIYLKWTPNDKLDITLASQMQILRNHDTFLQEISYPGELFYRPNSPGFAVYDRLTGPSRHTTQSHTLTAHWDSPIGQVTSITNYSTYHAQTGLDFGDLDCYCYLSLAKDHGSQYSEEMRDTFHPFEDVEVLVGVFGQVWKDDTDGFSLTAFADPEGFSRGGTVTHTSNASAFTQAYWNVTDRFRLQAGLRVSWDKVYLYRANYSYRRPGGTDPLLGFNNLNGAILLPGDPANPPSDGEHSWVNIGAKVGADYKFTDDVMAYGYYARGFKAGGFNGRVSRAEDIGPYNPEYVNSFELGLKSEWLDHRLRLNLAAFLNKWSQMQVPQTVFANGGATMASVILNAGSATTKGIEIQAEVVPVDGLTLNATLGYLSAAYDQFLSGEGALCPPPPAAQPMGCSIDYSGRALPFAPMWSASAGAIYAFEVANGLAEASFEYTYAAKKWGNYTQAPTEALPSVGLINANLSWGPTDSKWTIEMWARNLTNEHYLAAALDVPPLFTESVMGNPREFGATLRFNY